MRIEGGKDILALTLSLLYIFFQGASSQCSCGIGSVPGPDSIIVAPWTVRIVGKRNKNNLKGICTGAILSSTAVVSDESCFDYDETVEVFALLLTEDLKLGKGVVTKTQFDYLIVQMNSFISFNETVSPICVKPLNLEEGTEAYVTSKKFSSSSVARMEILNKTDKLCKKDDSPLEDDKICAQIIGNNGNFCNEGFGQPLSMYVNGSWYLIGVNYKHPVNCKGKEEASIFTLIAGSYDQVKDSKKGDGEVCTPITTTQPPTTTTPMESTTTTPMESTTTTPMESTTTTPMESTTTTPMESTTMEQPAVECDLSCFFDTYLPELRNETFEVECTNGICQFENNGNLTLCAAIEIVSKKVNK